MTGTIIALGGGGFSMEESPLLDDYLLGSTQKSDPRVLFVPTASGDSLDYIVRYYRALSRRARCRHVELFRRREPDLRALVLDHDLIYVGGGNTVNMLAIWRVQGFNSALAEAYRAGVVLAGISAGAVCWFEGTVTDSLAPDLRPLRDGLALLPGVMVPHYDGDAARRTILHGLLHDGTFASAWAADDGAALRFDDGRLTEVVTSRPNAAGWWIDRDEAGAARETRLDVRYLGS